MVVAARNGKNGPVLFLYIHQRAPHVKTYVLAFIHKLPIEVQIKVQPQTAGQLLPGSYQYSLVQTLLADFLPDALRVRLSLVGQRQDFPTATLSTRHTRLGQSGCLAVRSTHQQQRCQLSYQLTAL